MATILGPIRATQRFVTAFSFTSSSMSATSIRTMSTANAHAEQPVYRPLVFRTKAEVRAWRNEQTRSGKSVGFVPTMGALHDGHVSLVQSSLRMNDRTIVSIFVNPSQFAPSEDLASYPRTFEADLDLLSRLYCDIGPLKEAARTGDALTMSKATAALSGASGASPDVSSENVTQVDAVFVPTVDEMYPSGIPLERNQQTGAFVSVEGLSSVLEGAVRPQFFRGVATVVTKLLNIVNPTRVYFGQKDVQQTVVIKRMVSDLCYDIAVIIVPTKRAQSGLALSSRNAYLSEQTQADAVAIYKGLAAAEQIFRKDTRVSTIVSAIESSITTKFPKEDIEYITVSDPITLEEIKDKILPLRGAIVSLAVRVPNNFGKKTRLIDNIIL
ncbi:Pantoate-beta-alanine ligase-domain-containing protein [Lipomyces oligophaga]|uniref:Pantoate-beta-alanine ligase-domain-containing protein n=1 Tax=Lipomyces oligophaga TaxID=45792 RepID=UPI0034CEAFD9